MRLVRLVSVTAVATATCALWALPASAATAASHARHPSTTSVSVSPSPAWVGQRVRLSARVRSSSGTPTGTVAFLSFGRTMCVAHLSHGAGACNSSFGAVNTYIVRGFYSGDRTHRGSVGATTVIVRRSPTTTTITNPSPGSVLAGHPYTVKVTVTARFGTPIPTGTVKVAPTSPTGLPGAYSCTAKLTAGKGSCQVTPGAGTFGDIFYEATYSSNKAHTKSVSTGKHELIVPETTMTSVSPATAAHGSVTLTATVIGQAKGNISPSAGGTGTVTFTITEGTTAVATCSSEPLTYEGGGANNATCMATLTAGTYTVTAAYSGDPNNLKSMATETLTVT
jgi:hypothetical protein